jgi:L-alanine-DL-glutamate epimerase-like enolase superfamily enzyme
LSASMQAFVGLQDHRICEYPVEPKQVAYDLSVEHIELNSDGEITAPDAPGLGISVNLDAVRPYLRTVEIRIDNEQVYQSPVAESAKSRVVI